MITFNNLTVSINNGYVNKFSIGSDGNVYRWNMGTTSWDLDALRAKK